MSYTCYDCPRNCGAERNTDTGTGFCRSGENISVAKIMRHLWEEPCLNLGNGTENIFLGGCNLKCAFCQNYKINGSVKRNFEIHSPEEFGRLLIKCGSSGADTVGIVSGDHFIRTVSEAITESVKAAVNVPIVFNCNGYEKPELLEMLRGKIDIFMPDFKFFSKETAKEYANAPDYPEICKAALDKCFELAGPAKFDSRGLLTNGVIIRHLIMPGKIRETLSVIDYINEHFAKDEIVFSLMSQYTPVIELPLVSESPLLSRKITKAENKKAVNYLLNCENITLFYTQETDSANINFIPDF